MASASDPPSQPAGVEHPPLSLELGREVTLQEIREVAHGRQVVVAPAVVSMLARRRAQIVSHVRKQAKPAYGFNRGFGHNVDVAVPADSVGELQENLIRSHSAGLGPPAPREVVRATMLLRAVSLSKGHSGVRPDVVQAMIGLLNADITPRVPVYGSVGASGDLAPLSHVALALLGEGEVFEGGDAEPVPAAEALERAGLQPLRLQMKEGLALNNGLQFSTAFGVLSYFQMRDLLRTAAVATALSTQVMLGADTPFLAALHELRPHPGAKVVARWIWTLLQGSPIRDAHRPYDIDGAVQDPYNLRCAAEILGTCYDLIEEAGRTLHVEANSVTDNPILLRAFGATDQYTEIVSGGHFHGMPVAVKLYNFLQAMGIISRLSNVRCARYVDESRNRGLGSDLKWPYLDEAEQATSSAMMIPEYASAALTNAIWSAAMPSHLFSLSTDAGQEDHVSMSAGLALRVWETLPRLAEILAIELAFVSQAAAIRGAMSFFPSKKSLTPEQAAAVRAERDAYEAAIRRVVPEEAFGVQFDLHLKYNWRPDQRLLSPVCEEVLAAVQQAFPPVQTDRVLADQLTALGELVQCGRIAAIAGRAMAE